MALTRAAIEVILIRRIGRWLTAAGLDGTTDDGTNEDLADPIAYAVRAAGYDVTDASAPADADLAEVESADYDKVIDLAELRALENCLQNFTDVDAQAGPARANQDDLGQRIERAIARKRAQIAAAYSIGGGSVVWSSVDVTYGDTSVDEFSWEQD